MEPNLFRNRWLALAFVGLILAGAMVLVGSEGEEGVLDRFMRDGGRDAEVVEDLGDELEPPSPELLVTSPESSGIPEAVGTFASDEELIDDAEGFATTPMIVHEGPGDDGRMLEAEGETVIVPADDQGSGF